MADTNCSFSIIIPTFNRADLLCQCLDRLDGYFESGIQNILGLAIEVIVTDDARQPELRSLLEQRYPWCNYTHGPASGPAANRNHGAHLAINDWLVFTDDDCLPQPGWIESYAISAVQCDVMEGRTSADGIRERLDQECPINESGGFLWSCNFAIRRDLFLELGGFNVTFPAPAMEDVELNERINKLGFRRKFVYSALVHHPWRRRKGVLFINSHALSVARFVLLHPEQAFNFTLSMQMYKCLRSIKTNISYSLTNRNTVGLLRQISLDCYSYIAAWMFIRKYNRPLT